MSIAGIRSNRGDAYQTLIAFDWALTVLTDPEYQWLEIDSTTHPVDDVVVGKSDDTLICCQCKKNQTDFRAWSVANLAEELDKASRTLARNRKAEVCFYSRSEFGAVAKLREFSRLCRNETEYQSSLTVEHTKTNAELGAIVSAGDRDLSTYEFLRRISFEISPDFVRIETLLRERLRRIASNSNAAYDALWIRLDKLGGRIEDNNLAVSTPHRLTKDDFKEILHQAGSILVPEMSTALMRSSLGRTSAIGRSWRRDIAGQRISSPVVNELLAAIDARKHAILLTGLPGSGKTCVMLSLQDALEQRMQCQTDLVSLFIQSREFADLVTAQDRQAQGLPQDWVEQVARFAEDAHVVVVIDSLDVLSIAREHDILTYFLAQIDRLLLIPNVTLVAACRDFDRKYDRRIAVRQWDCELQCLPLEWETDVAPLLDNFSVDSGTIDTVTRELIRNPRELALFLELAQREGTFNVVTSQALAQRYLNTIVQADPALGDTAMQAIEAIADKMLKSRSLTIPHQRFSASQDILRRLRSLNVLQDTHDANLTFGHQTLLDVLVIRGAIRRGVSLNEFIEGLPPVPFVRPSIRSFVAQLATGERREFRKQLRAVLTSNAAFHIRRLIAESFAQQIPQEEDWPLIRDLRKSHSEVYQVIYTQAMLVEWHHFWFSHLVPALKEMRDSEGLMAHVHRIAQWANEDTATVLRFWEESLDLDWLDSSKIAEQLVFSLSEIKTENLILAAPLLDRLLSMSKSEHSWMGRTIARGIGTGALDDRFLWRYITADIKEDDVMKYAFDKKLRSHSYEFGDKDDNFLSRRMTQSTVLLDLALETIEEWSQIRATHYGETRIGYRSGFLSDTSYSDIHSETVDQHISSERILFDAIEGAVLDHAQKHSDWWLKNRERLSFNHEGALCYLAITAFTNSPESNLDLIGRLLCDRNLLEFELEFELGTLTRSVFIYLDSATQDAAMEVMQSIWEETTTNEETHYWILKKRTEYVSSIPCHLRSAEAQTLVDSYEELYGPFIQQPSISMHGGWVTAPFSFEVFLNASDDGVVRLLAHYHGYKEDFADFLVGGEREVGWQLREAACRHPSRFLRLLILHWVDISTHFRDEIMDGIVNSLAHTYGNSQISGTWEPVEEPEAISLASLILDELERHSAHWRLNRSTANALEVCANVVQGTQDASRIVFLAIGFGQLREESTIQGDSVDLLTTGINMANGKIAEAMMILANGFHERESVLPELLPPTLCRIAGDKHPAIRALILRRLPYLQSRNSELGWNLFHRAMQDAIGLWQSAERCLYYAYRDQFKEIAPLLDRIAYEGSNEDMETWGRISALSALVEHIDLADLLGKLRAHNITEAWQGAASVWTNPNNVKRHREQCRMGIDAGLRAGKEHAAAVASQVSRIFEDSTSPVPIPIELIRLCFSVFEENNKNEHHALFRFGEWLNATSQRDPELALAVTEIYLEYVKRNKTYFYDHENRLVQLMTRLFGEAEEREESDRGAMLKRVVAAQDLLLSLGLNSINDWLKAAERN